MSDDDILGLAYEHGFFVYGDTAAKLIAIVREVEQRERDACRANIFRDSQDTNEVPNE